MKRTAKIWLIVAACLVVLGPVIIVCAAAAGGADFGGFGKTENETNVYEVGSTFDQIAVDTAVTDIEIATADEKQCKVVCAEPKDLTHSVQVQDGKLVIGSTDTRKWYEHIFDFTSKSPKMTIYLPQTAYASLQIDTNTGDVMIPEGFSFDTITISGDTADIKAAATADSVSVKVSTGNVRLSCPEGGSIDIVTSTGKIDLMSSAVTGKVSIKTDTGDVKLEKLTCADLTAESTTGDITLSDTVADKLLQIDTTTGDVEFDRCDAADIAVNTGTGDVTGTLLSDKIFTTQTSTGDVHVPQTTTGGKCQITTSTGDILIEIASK